MSLLRGIRDETLKTDAALFLFITRNQKAYSSFKKIKDGNIVKTKSALSWIDGIGLDCLHYAIIFGNEAELDFCLKNHKWLPRHTDSSESRYLELMDYSLAAELAGRRDLAIKIEESIGTVGALIQVRKNIERAIKIREYVNQKAETYTRSAERTIKMARKRMNSSDYAEYIRIREADEKIERQKESIDANVDKINTLKDDLMETEREIDEARKRFIRRLSESADYYRSSHDLYINSIKRILENGKALEDILNLSETTITVDEYIDNFYFETANGFFFVWGADCWTKQIYRDSQESSKQNSGTESSDRQKTHRNENKTESQKKAADSKQGNNTSHREKFQKSEKRDKASKKYGTSWFSEDAHKDYRTLQREYRNLAKEYHPDVGRWNENVFKEINQERADILGRMSR